MPPPPAEEEDENKTPDEDSNLQFSHVECLMYAFHQLGAKYPDFLTGDKNVDRLKDFKIRYVKLFITAHMFEQAFGEYL